MNILLDILVFAAVALGVFGIASLVVPSGISAAPLAANSVLRGNSAAARHFARFSGSLLPSNLQERREVRLLFLQADFDAPKAAEIYYGIRVILALALPALTLGALALGFHDLRRMLPFALMAALIGFTVPALYVSHRRKKNQQLVREGLPDVLDLLLVCSEAGLGLDMAIARVGEELALSQPLLSKHLRQIGSELRAGRTRVDAMRGFADRTGTVEALSLVRLLVQSDIQGTSIVDALRTFSDEMRAHRTLRAEEAAQKMSAKLSVILIFSFMPALFIAIGGPVVFKLFAALKGLAQ